MLCLRLFVRKNIKIICADDNTGCRDALVARLVIGFDQIRSAARRHDDAITGSRNLINCRGAVGKGCAGFFWRIADAVKRQGTNPAVQSVGVMRNFAPKAVLSAACLCAVAVGACPDRSLGVAHDVAWCGVLMRSC